MIDAALRYVSRGWRVLPLHWILEDGTCSCRKACESPGKHPVSRLVPNGSHGASANPNEVRGWWSVLPHANIGIATGEGSGLVVLDVDPRHGGTETVKMLIERHGDFTRTLWVTTGSGGQHYYFRHPGYPVKNSVGALGTGVDVRGEAGYVVAPPSKHVEGAYRWAFDDEDAELAAMPGWVSAKDNRQSSAKAVTEGVIPKGVQHDTLVSLAGTVRRRGCTEAEIYAFISQVNRRCQEPGPDSNIRKIAQSIAQYEPAEVLSALDEVIADTSGKPAFVSLGDSVGEVLERSEKARATGGVLPGLSLGFDKLDDMLLGAQPSDLLIVAARPSMGKTAFAVQLARTFATQKPGAVFSVEMARLAIAGRFLSAASEVDSQDIRTGRYDEADAHALKRAAAELARLPVFINDESGITARRMSALLREIEDLGWVIVDYLQMVQAAEKGSNRQEDVASISRGLKGIAKEYDVPVVALAQLSRKNESRGDKTPVMSDLRESGQIEQDADVIMFIHRPEKYGDTHMEVGGVTTPSAGLAQIIIAKQRNGPVGDVVLHFEDRLARFSDYDRVRHAPVTNGSADDFPF